MNKKRIILISGKARSGKDVVRNTMINYLLEKCDVDRHEIKTIRFADTLKDGLAKMLNTSRKTVDVHKEKEQSYKDINIRKALQDLGSQLRDQNPDIFAVNAIEDVAKQKPTNIIFIPDLRYPNEQEIFQYSKFKNEYVIIKIVRPYIDKLADTNDVYQHHSETSMDQIKYDYLINNDSTLSDLKSKITDIAEKIFGEK